MIPKAFVNKLEINRLSLLKNGLPYQYHKYAGFNLEFKTINYSENNKKMLVHPFNKQNTIYQELISKAITKPMVIGIGSYPTDIGCLACATSLLYKFQDNHKSFNIVTLSSLLNIPKELLNQEYAPEVVCILDLVEDGTIFNIENAKTLMAVFANSVVIVPAVTKNIIDFFRNRLHKQADISLQVNNIRKIEEI